MGEYPLAQIDRDWLPKSPKKPKDRGSGNYSTFYNKITDPFKMPSVLILAKDEQEGAIDAAVNL